MNNDEKNKILIECCRNLGYESCPISIEMDDDIVRKLILRCGFEYTKLYNQYLILKYAWDYISTDLNINKYEQLLLIHYEQTQQGNYRALILSNLEILLNSLINEYTQVRYNLYYLEIPHVAVPLNTIQFSCQIPDDFLTKLIIKKTTRCPLKVKTQELRLIKQELIEDINLNIKVSTIYRCSLLQITNNACKTNKTELAAKVLFTCGSTLIVENTLFKKLTKMLSTTKLPLTKAQKLIFKENGSLEHLYNNLNFSYNLWLTKFKNKIDPNLLSETTLKECAFDINNITHVINHLNSINLRINKVLFSVFKSLIESSNSYKSILQYHECTKTSKPIHTVLDESVEATSDENFNINILHTKNAGDYLEYSLIISQLNNLLDYASGSFYLKYVLDGRSRIYVYQWPINYQLNHFVRNIIDLAEMDDNWTIYKKFFCTPEYVQYKEIYNLWKIHTINYIKVQELLNIYKSDINLTEIAALEPNCSKNLKKLLLVESLLSVLASLAPSSYVNLQDRINYSANWLCNNTSVTDLLTKKERFVDNIFNKDDFSQIKKILTFKKIIENKVLTDIWWADASSNALQLIVLTRGTNSRMLLQLLNLIENTTEYKNIYSFIASQLKILDYSTVIVTENAEFLQLIDISLAKSIAMPAAYGKTFWSCKKTIKKNLAAKSSWWATLTSSIQDALCFLWYTNTFKILTSLGLDLKDHIQRCKKAHDTTIPIYSHFKIPIFTRTIKILNRTAILHKLKTKKQLLKELIQYTPNIKNLKDLTDAQLELLLAQELAKLSPDAENAYNLQQAQKTIKSIQLQKKLLVESNASTRRINVIIKKKIRIQFRVSCLTSGLVDLQRSNTAVAPNITHAYDAAILFFTIEKLINLQIPCVCIHDSIGCRLEHLPIIIYMYKYSLITTVKTYYSQDTRYFPYTKDDPYELANISFPKEILNSTNLFY